MEKKPFLTESMAQDIIQDVPTPFHVYDEKGIRENARRINKAFSWNKGFREYFSGQGSAEPRHPPDPEGRGLRRGLLLSDRADAQRSVRLQRQRHHVLLQPDPCGGHEEGLRAGRLYQPRRRHDGGLPRPGGRCAGEHLLPLQSGRHLPAGREQRGLPGHGQARRRPSTA